MTVGSPLISPEDLATRMDDPQVRVVDVRWVLGQRGEGRRRYGVRQQVDRSGIKHDSSLDGPSHGLRSAATLGSAGRPS